MDKMVDNIHPNDSIINTVSDELDSVVQILGVSPNEDFSNIDIYSVEISDENAFIINVDEVMENNSIDIDTAATKDIDSDGYILDHTSDDTDVDTN